MAWETRLYPLVRGGPKRITIKWRDNWQDFSVYFDGQSISADRNGGTLNSGLQFTLADGYSFSVWVESNALHVVRDGKPLPGSHGDRVPRLYLAAAVIMLNALLTFGSGLLLLTTPSQLGVEPISAAINIFFAVVYAILAYNVLDLMRGALWIALILYGLEILLTTFVALSALPMLLICLPARVVFIVLIYMGFEGIEARQAEAEAEYKDHLNPGIFSNNLLKVGQRILLAGFALDIFLCVLMTSVPRLFYNIVFTPTPLIANLPTAIPTRRLTPSQTPRPTVIPLVPSSRMNMPTRTAVPFVSPGQADTELEGWIEGQVEEFDSSHRISKGKRDINGLGILRADTKQIRIKIENWHFDFKGTDLRMNYTRSKLRGIESVEQARLLDMQL